MVIDKLIHHIRDPNSVKLKTEIPQKNSPGSMSFSWRELPVIMVYTGMSVVLRP